MNVRGACPVEAHAELPAQAELADGIVISGNELCPGLPIVVVGECELRLEDPPEVVDVMLTASLVAGECKKTSR